jgi:hypothetical protein
LSLRSPGHKRVRNIIPLPVSVAPTLKYYIGNIVQGPRLSFLSIITPQRTRKRMEQIELAIRIYRVGTKMAPCTRCENSNQRCVALPQEGKNNDCCAEYTCFRKLCDIRSRNRMPLVSEWSSIDC